VTNLFRPDYDDPREQPGRWATPVDYHDGETPPAR